MIRILIGLALLALAGCSMDWMTDGSAGSAPTALPDTPRYQEQGFSAFCAEKPQDPSCK
jgi:hypothetical protein